MIGNDIVDLTLAKKESNCKRVGFLEKIFTENEQKIIHNSKNQELAIWSLWSRKEAVYKIYNRITGIRKFNPLSFDCDEMALKHGKVFFENQLFFTKTETNDRFIYTIAVTNFADFENIIHLDGNQKIIKVKGIPYCYFAVKQSFEMVSKTHHGDFLKIISINSQS